MRLNENIKIVGRAVILVPYESKHVAKYHEWMKNEELQQLTASEPLTLDEEYEMQKSWRVDEDKCTFLILDRALFEKTGDEIAALVGDTNIFLQSTTEAEDPQGQGTDQLTNSERRTAGEIEIMIAEASARGKRFGWEATLLMLLFGVEHLHIEHYLAITKDSNTRAMQMFERMKFLETKRTPVFREVTFGCTIDESWLGWVKCEVGSYTIEPYHTE
ncbi:alpha/beta-tubulin-N-acetyltransferase 9 [Anopheles ziemanni]|uniref:alpha/beta-tubulin-N-acetyltransferase 9 n=1 Tax=Anopheles coustani TaxID=139045 RepID=UPI002657BB91|nr:alpha/beta-tubulin-N-acetyltransferase 9 [Anopheles coustani]XP_058168210.1 alpha/beta-tubulin-N-acetyltransferase 9 [Anopheles ziemanni]